MLDAFYRPGAEWVIEWGLALQLRTAEFCQIPVAWALFFVQTLETASNQSQFIVKRCLGLLSLLRGKRWKVRRLVHKPRDGGCCSSTIRTGHSLADVQMSSAYLALNGTGNSNADIFPKVSQWISDVSDSDSAPNYEDLQSAERWLADCFKDTDMQI
ncbi:hypothetical protein KIW84_043235 [Lathyrus oleraceus]|uniref:Uncharacterized protein n=1 Tax=Pisum sativum TaxID=3888 RepID=A0A9D4XEN9_PEA|nr:hypothetical protein KIW84_043235 [Pisum sativum]